MIALLLSVLLLGPALLVAIPVHEMGHVVAAYFQGDRSVRYFGYFSWNPRRFLDPLGSIAVFIALVGWGRKVPIQSSRISTVRQKVVFELGGPAANLLVAVVCGTILRLGGAFGLHAEFAFTPGLLGAAIFAIMFLNLSVLAFQLLPIPGLDGWNIVDALFRDRNPRFFFDVSSRRREIWVGAIVIAFIYSIASGGGSLLSFVMIPFYAPASWLALGQCAGYVVPNFIALWPCLR